MKTSKYKIVLYDVDGNETTDSTRAYSAKRTQSMTKEEAKAKYGEQFTQWNNANENLNNKTPKHIQTKD